MGDLALILAIFEKLTGAPLDSSGVPLRSPDGELLNRQKSLGLRVPAPAHPADGRVLSTRFPWLGLFSEGYQQHSNVPVRCQFAGIQGTDWDDVFPSCSFNVLDYAPAEVLFNHEAESHSVAQGDYNDPDGVPVRDLRPAAGRWNITVVFTLRARDPFELALLCHNFRDLWNVHGSVFMRTSDGGEVPAPYEFLRYSAMDGGEFMNAERTTDGHSPRQAHLTYEFRGVPVDNASNGYGSDSVYTTELIQQVLLHATYDRSSAGEPGLAIGTERTEILP